LRIGEVLFLLQAVMGGILYFSGLRPAQLVHLLYGALGVFALPAAYTYSRGGDDRRGSLIYSLICLFLFGVALRAITTAGP
jgi:hypothetical protein